MVDKSFNVNQLEIPDCDLEVLLKCRSFPYKGKREKVWLSVLIGAGILAAAFIAGIILAVGTESGTQAASVTLLLGFIVFLAFVIKVRQFDKMKELTQYFRDENGNYFRVIFTQGASIAVSPRRTVSGTSRQLGKALEKTDIVQRNVEEAQASYPAFYYIQRYKSGIKDWDVMNGGLAKVSLLEGFALKKRGKRSCVFSCKINGRQKNLKISNAYAGLAEESQSL